MIASHIKDGIDIAKEYRVPKVVLDVIAQHHGTSLVQYFFTQMAGERALDGSRTAVQVSRPEASDQGSGGGDARGFGRGG